MFENCLDWAISSQGSNRARFNDHPYGSTLQVIGNGSGALCYWQMKIWSYLFGNKEAEKQVGVATIINIEKVIKQDRGLLLFLCTAIHGLLLGYLILTFCRKDILTMNIKEINSSKKFGFSCIYLWTNLSNDKHYVGSAKNFYNRMSAYKRGKFNPYMKSAIEKYGFDGFDISIIEIVEDENNLIQREQFWIDHYQSYKRELGYNICEQAGNTLGYHHTEETKDLLRQQKKEQFERNPSLRDKWVGLNNPMYGKTHDEEWRQNHSEWLKQKWEDEEYQRFWRDKMSGENNPMYGVRLIGELNPRYGQHCTDETKDKIANALRGRPNISKRKKAQCVETGEIFEKIGDIAKKLCVNQSSITPCLNNPNRTCKGLHFITI